MRHTCATINSRDIRSGKNQIPKILPDGKPKSKANQETRNTKAKPVFTRLLYSKGQKNWPTFATTGSATRNKRNQGASQVDLKT